MYICEYSIYICTYKRYNYCVYICAHALYIHLSLRMHICKYTILYVQM